MHIRPSLRVTGIAGIALFALIPPPVQAADSSASAETDVVLLPALTVNGAASAVPDQYQIPATVQTVAAAQIADTVNAVDPEDMLKYEPDLFLRKRNYGDTQAVLATRTWGVNSSARSLVYVDGVPLSALIANNNTIGAPRWGMVVPDAIQSVDVVYGPYAAAYPGNSMGAAVEITTRMPDRLEASVATTEAWQDFSLYSTHNTYAMNQTAVTVGDRIGKWSFWVSANNEGSNTQPLLFVTAGSLPTGTSGGIIAWNKLGQPANVLGASGILDADFATANVRVAYDFAPQIRATYSFGIWDGRTNSTVQTYLRDASGQPTFAAVSGFASGFYQWTQEHTMQSLAIRSRGSGAWDWDLIGSLYDFDKDTQRSPSSASSSGTTLSTAGKVALLGGTGWSTADAKAAWHPDGRASGQELSFGAHYDRYELVNPTYVTPDWRSGRTFSSLATEGNGDTATAAVWIQDVWPLGEKWKLTVGGRYESWRAFDGVNINGKTTVIQPEESSSNFSPKATLAWNATPGWTLTALAGNAYRYPTAGELYQLVSTGTTFTSPDPNLRPEKVWAEEIRAEHKLSHGLLRVSCFEEDTHDALVSQYSSLVPGSSTQYQYVMNVEHIRNRGAEIYLDQNDMLISGLEVSGSVTYVDSRILADSGQGQLSAAVGKKAPYVPMWRATFAVTYRPVRSLALTVAGRYSGQQYSTVDNTDVNPDAFGGFQEFFVLDTHFNWKFARRWALSGGVDNLLNRKFFLYHPFPQRTAVADLSFSF
ncbi:MAG TPA: TonB-dependent receptor [Nitrospiria bacterium]|nr:TonB-dependent receptor [Nitrospiria bacterium]